MNFMPSATLTVPHLTGARTARAMRRGSMGFTLVELMVTLSVLAILLSIAAPSFSALLAANRMSTQTNELVGALNLARSEAVRRGQPVALRSADADNFSKGWKVFTDADGDGNVPGTVTETDGTMIREASAYGGTIKTQPVTRAGTAGAFTYAASTAAERVYLVFDARGANTAGAASFFKVCDPSNTSVKGRIVQVNVVGKITLDNTALTCP